VLTEGGYQLLANWLVVAGLSTAKAAAKGLTPHVNLS
jgi:para-aminobenzoate synthetase component 2